MDLTITIHVLSLTTRSHVAVTQIAGVTIRGRRADTQAMAVRNLLASLSDPNADDPALAVDLLVEGKSLTQLLGDGSATA